MSQKHFLSDERRAYWTPPFQRFWKKTCMFGTRKSTPEANLTTHKRPGRLGTRIRIFVGLTPSQKVWQKRWFHEKNFIGKEIQKHHGQGCRPQVGVSTVGEAREMSLARSVSFFASTAPEVLPANSNKCFLAKGQACQHAHHAA